MYLKTVLCQDKRRSYQDTDPFEDIRGKYLKTVLCQDKRWRYQDTDLFQDIRESIWRQSYARRRGECTWIQTCSKTSRESIRRQSYPRTRDERQQRKVLETDLSTRENLGSIWSQSQDKRGKGLDTGKYPERDQSHRGWRQTCPIATLCAINLEKQPQRPQSQREGAEVQPQQQAQLTAYNSSLHSRQFTVLYSSRKHSSLKKQET
jgi:hypothetical protein